MDTLRNATVPSAMMGRPGGGSERIDIGIEGGRIASISPASGGEGRDLDGGLVLPAFADIHTHLDKGHIWPRSSNPDGTFMSALEAVAADREHTWSAEDVRRRMEFSLRCAYAHGTAAIRTHLDAVPPQDGITWPVFAEMRAAWRGRIELQGVSLVGPDHLLDRESLEALAKIAKRHGGILGGAIASHPRSAEAMRNVVAMAAQYDLDIDIHADETLDPASRTLEDLADAVIAARFGGSVVAGHCCALAVQDSETQKRTIDKVARANIAVVSLPMCNLYLQDRAEAGHRTPIRRGVTALHELRAAGVKVALASDNTRDPFYAYGDLDALEVLREGSRIAHFDHPQDEAWAWARAVSADAAAIAGFEHGTLIAVGAPADLVLFRARSWTELLARPQADRTVLRGGVAIDTSLPDYRELDELMEA